MSASAIIHTFIIFFQFLSRTKICKFSPMEEGDMRQISVLSTFLYFVLLFYCLEVSLIDYSRLIHRVHFALLVHVEHHTVSMIHHFLCLSTSPCRPSISYPKLALITGLERLQNHLVHKLEILLQFEYPPFLLCKPMQEYLVLQQVQSLLMIVVCVITSSIPLVHLLLVFVLPVLPLVATQEPCPHHRPVYPLMPIHHAPAPLRLHYLQVQIISLFYFPIL